MKKRYSIGYFIGQAFKGLFRNGVMSFASIMVLMSCLVVIGGFSLLVMNINENLEQFGLLNEIVVFAYPEATDEEIVELEGKIKTLDNVEKVEHTTKAEALEQMKQQAGSQYKGLYDDITPENNPLSDSFTITYKDNDRVTNLEYQLGEIEQIKKVNNRADIAKTISNFKSGVMLVFIWFLAILFIVSMFVIINTIKLAVFSRRHEISIMRYVGATKWFITLPFVFEGMLIGIFASGIAYGVEWYIYQYIEKMVMGDLQMISIIKFSEVNVLILLVFLGIGLFSGIVGSCISLNKYLKS